MLVKGNTLKSLDIRSILLIQLGDIGDVVWATPTFRAVKEAYPRANVSVLLRDPIGSLLAADPHIHKIFEVKRYGGDFLKNVKAQFKLLRTLRRERFDLVFDLRSDDRGTFTAFLSGAPVRASIIYYAIPWRNKFFTHLAAPPPVDKTNYTAADQSLRVARAFGIESQNDVPELWVPEDVQFRVKKMFDQEGISDKYLITLNPFSRWKYKEYGYDNWVEIIDWLWKDYKIASIIVGSAEERGPSEFITQRCRGRVFNFTGKTTLAELAGVLSRSALHLGVDSAAPHIAAVVGTPTITIYGPSDWKTWSHRGDMHSVVVPDLVCVPCRNKGCNNEGISKCLEELEVDTIKEAVRTSLNKILHLNAIR